MKKYCQLFIIFILSFLVNIPIIYAENSTKKVNFKNVTITGNNKVESGNEIELLFDFAYDNLIKEENMGIAYILFTLEYDENVLMPTEVTASDFKTIMFKNDDKIYVYAETIKNVTSKNNCANQILYCSNFLVKIKFYAKEKMDTSSIKINRVETYVADVDNVKSIEDISDDKFIQITNIVNKSHTLNIKQGEVKDEPTSVISLMPQNRITSKELTNVRNDSSTLLRELSIRNYDIKFNKEIKTYNLSITENVNELDISLQTESANATYTINGNKDLKANDYKVTIEVCNNENKTIYTINASIKDDEAKELKDRIKKDNENVQVTNKKEFKIDKKYIKFSLIGIVIILLIMLIGFIISKIKNHKMKKLLDKM